MCGISGAIGFPEPLASDAVRRMVASMRHRGPDDHGIYESPGGDCVLGHNRLAILDTSRAGHQPMASDDARYRVTFNGEIYNYRSVRRELEAEGRVFTTQTDTEVLLAAFQQWGDSAVNKFRGMFAFAIWDAKEQRLHLGRDRLGIKPLYYTLQPGGFAFASEVTALLRSGLVPRRADRSAICWYLMLGSVPQPSTIVSGVKMLPAGHIAIYEDRAIQMHRYWSAAEHALLDESAVDTDFATAARGLRKHLEQAAALHMIADVPVGAFLSGGVDSRLVVGLMSQQSTRPIQTFSIGFADSTGFPDELAGARAAAEDFGCDHAEVMLTPCRFVEALPAGVAAIDQPSVDGFNTFLVSEAARHGVTVALSGLGGDEFFCGYPHMWEFVSAPADPSVLRRAAHRVFGGLLPHLPGRVRRRLGPALSGQAERLTYARQQVLCSQLQSVVAWNIQLQETCPALSAHYESLLPDGTDLGNKVAVAEIDGYLRDTLLRDCDAMSMAHSLEVRPILLDHVLAEYTLALPGRWKVGGRLGKRILIEACRDLLPLDIDSRPKRGFELPIFQWLVIAGATQLKEALAVPVAETVFSDRYLGQLRAAAAARGPKRTFGRLWQAFVLLSYLTLHELSVTE